MTPNSFGIFNFLVFLTIIQGLLLSCILIFNKKFQKKANYALAAALFGITLLGIGQIMYNLNWRLSYPIIPFLPIRYTLFPAIGLYYYIIFQLNDNYRFSKKDNWIVSPFVLLVVIDLVLLAMYLVNSSRLLEHSHLISLYHDAKELIAVLFSFMAVVWAIKETHQLPEQINTKINKNLLEKLHWAKNNILATAIAWSAWAIPQTYVILFGKDFWWMYYPTWIGMFIMIVWLGYFMILQRDFFEVSTEENKPKDHPLSEKAEEHYQTVLKLMVEEKLYRNPALNMKLLAEKANLSNGYLSQIINQKEGKNFYDFVNTYRIEEVKMHLLDPNYAHYSILGIGLEAGFKSKSTFNTAFKKMTGQTPTAFKNS